MGIPRAGSPDASSFNFFTTAQDVVEAFPDVAKGRTAVVTGGNSGIGAETVRALARAGCSHVVLCARNISAGEQVAKEINDDIGSDVVSVVHLDLADLDSVSSAAGTIRQRHPSINYLVLNAGIMACPQSRTKQGFEMQMGTNHIGHFYFWQNIQDSVIKAGSEEFPSRVVAVSSIAHKMGSIRLDDLNFETRRYWAWRAYGDSKLANILFARQLAKSMTAAGNNVLVYCLHPGSIVTGLQKYSPLSRVFQGFFKWMSLGRGSFAFSTKTVPEGAATTLVACLVPGIPTGSYLSDCQVASTTGLGEDEEMMKDLWIKTADLCK
jgi:NAD(P)-dependent dehydrogenase (short-subunit alcohol dehydrogenase family)